MTRGRSLTTPTSTAQHRSSGWGEAPLGILLQASDPDLARTHFKLALTATRRRFSLFAHIEMQALAATALGEPRAASMLAAMRDHRLPTDTFRKPIYDLLARQALPGLDALIQLWQEILADDPTAARPFILPRQ